MKMMSCDWQRRWWR